MGGTRWKIATVRGIPLYVGTSWIFIAALFVYSQYLSLTEGAPRSTPAEALSLSLLAAGLFFGSVLAHESAHAIMARSLDLPVTGITLVFWGGATETRASGRGPLGEFLVAFVGPATTLALAGVFWVTSQAVHGLAADILHYLSRISLLFAVLNALPGFPLDGGRMLLAVLWGAARNRRTALRFTGYVGMVVGGGFIAFAIVNFTRLETFAIFLGYIGAVMIATGRSMDQRVAFLGQLARGNAADAMRPPPPTVRADMTLAEALDRYLRGTEGEAFPVVEAGRVIGMVSLSTARKTGGRNPMRPVREGMAPLTQTPTFSPDDTLDEVVEWLAGRDGLVLRDGALVGAIGGGDIERWYRRTIEGRVDTAATTTGGTAEPGRIPPRPDV